MSPSLVPSGTIPFWLIATLFAIVFILTTYFLPRILIRKDGTPAERTAIDERRRTLVQIGGGAALILSFTWTFLKDSETLTQSQATLEQTRQQNANQQFLASVQMLDDEKKPALAVAAIYSLDRIVAARSEYHMPTRDTLAGLARATSATRQCDPQDRTPDSSDPVKAAIRVLGLRDTRLDAPNRQLDLHDSALVRVSFRDAGTAFAGADFIGTVLFGADFRNAVLTNADFSGVCAGDYQAVGKKDWADGQRAEEPDWKDSQRYRYVVNFSGAHLEGARFGHANLAGAIFANEDIEASLGGNVFDHANLSRADFRLMKKRSAKELKELLKGACGGEPILLPGDERWKVAECDGR
jgi:uncharacterized protein YjbI with pentapeptide repeats